MFLQIICLPSTFTSAKHFGRYPWGWGYQQFQGIMKWDQKMGQRCLILVKWVGIRPSWVTWLFWKLVITTSTTDNFSINILFYGVGCSKSWKHYVLQQARCNKYQIASHHDWKQHKHSRYKTESCTCTTGAVQMMSKVRVCAQTRQQSHDGCLLGT